MRGFLLISKAANRLILSAASFHILLGWVLLCPEPSYLLRFCAAYAPASRPLVAAKVSAEPEK